MIFISFLREQTEKIWIKCSICAIYQPAEQNLLHKGNIFKDTVDPRERPLDRIFKRVFGVQLNYKTMEKNVSL